MNHYSWPQREKTTPAPEALNMWDKVERILDMLARNPIAPTIDQNPGSQLGPGAPQRRSYPSFGSPLQEHYRPFPNREPSWHEVADNIVAMLEREQAEQAQAETDQPADIQWPEPNNLAPRPADDASASAATTDSDDWPRIVAILPHKHEREIADEIVSKWEREDAVRTVEPTQEYPGGYSVPLHPEGAIETIDEITSRWEREEAAIIEEARQRSEAPDSGWGPNNLFGLIGQAQAQPRRPVRGREFRTPNEELRHELYRHWESKLRSVNPNHREATSLESPTFIPTVDQVSRMREVALEEARRAGLTPRRGGETETTVAGRVAHNWYDPGEEYEVNRAMRGSQSQRRPDAHIVRETEGEVREYKPDNPRAIHRGEREAAEKAKELKAIIKQPVKTYLETYDLPVFLRGAYRNDYSK